MCTCIQNKFHPSARGPDLHRAMDGAVLHLWVRVEGRGGVHLRREDEVCQLEREGRRGLLLLWRVAGALGFFPVARVLVFSRRNARWVVN